MRRLAGIVVASVLVVAGCTSETPLPAPSDRPSVPAPSASRGANARSPLPIAASADPSSPSVADPGPPEPLPSPATDETMGLDRGAAWFTDHGFSGRPFAVGPAWQVYMDYESVIFAPAALIGVSPSDDRGGGSSQDWWNGFEGAVEVLWAAKMQRFVAVAPLAIVGNGSTCGSSRLKIAVSASGDPRAPWTFSQAELPNVDGLAFDLAASDDKLAITSQDFCGNEPTGSHIRVMDLADLIDGGDVTVRDVTPAAPETHHWLASQPVPPEGTNQVGDSLHLIAVRAVDGAWTSFSYATLEGSARAGTARLSAPLDLTAAGILPSYADTGPLRAAEQTLPDPDPAEQAAFLDTGRGPTSAVARDGRLWAAFNRACRPDGDTQDRWCAQFVVLDTTTPIPTLVEEATFGVRGARIANPEVGVARDGTVYLTERQVTSFHHDPSVLVGTWRLPSEPIAGGRQNVLLDTPDGWSEPSSGAMVPDMALPGVVKVATGTELGADGSDTQGSDGILFLRLSRGTQ